jgi:NOL1/NOP2/sun family putative RNA methylase
VNTIFPPDFVRIIDNLLKEEADQFWDAQKNGIPAVGMRINPRKTSFEELKKILSSAIQPLPWTSTGAAIQNTEDTGKHPCHAAGLYYLQEPSAMVPVHILDPQPREKVLDLCAAPGGKTTQIHSQIGNQGVLIANDPNPKRVQALSRNLERWGTRNTAVLCETPQRIYEHLGDYFDRVLVDAPCSGEGTFRSAPGEIKKWSLEFSQRCCRIQDEILWFAAKMVRPGGVLVYSTCTFNQDENEGSIARFLEKNPDFSIDSIEGTPGFSKGIELDYAPSIDFSGTVRIWPHKTQGEGHYIACLRKSTSAQSTSSKVGSSHSIINPDHLDIYTKFYNNALNLTPSTQDINPSSMRLSSYGNRLYWIPSDMPPLEGLNVQHWGWWLGTFHTGKFNPSPALASALSLEDAQIVLEFSLEDPGLVSYLRGSPHSSPKTSELPDGWALVTCAGHALGWGKIHGGRLKSYMPRWLRSN